MPMTGKQVIAAMERAGWIRKRQKGSHVTMEAPDGRKVTVPHGTRDLKRGLLTAIAKITGLDLD